MRKSMSLRCEPSSEPLHISAQQLFLNRELHRLLPVLSALTAPEATLGGYAASLRAPRALPATQEVCQACLPFYHLAAKKNLACRAHAFSLVPCSLQDCQLAVEMHPLVGGRGREWCWIHFSRLPYAVVFSRQPYVIERVGRMRWVDAEFY